MKLLTSFRDYKKINIPGDILAGIIVAAMSVPISMGYAQIAGLPAIYGLYGSLLIPLIFGVFSTTRLMVFSVDAAPAALTGGVLATMGVAAESKEAMQLIPALTLFTAIWLLLLSLLKAGKLAKYISSAVMGGFISGIGCNVILMQAPKLMGGKPGTGELLELVPHLMKSIWHANISSALLGISTLAVLLLFKKFCPKFPIAIPIMIIAGVVQYYFHLERFGISMLPKVDGGLPAIAFPHITPGEMTHHMGQSIPIACVIVAETLLFSSSVAAKEHENLQDNQEIMAYGLCNFAASLIGCCPVSASVSRTAMAKQFNGKSHLTSFVSCICIFVLLLFGTSLVHLLPIPVMTAIVIVALMNILEFGEAKEVYHVDRSEFYIFMGAFISVLILGTIYGVLIGVVLSFAAVLRRSMMPPREFLGVISGHQRFYSLNRNKQAKSIKGVLIYRFSGPLFFANYSIFQNDIESHISEDIHVIIVDASAITSIDITAAKTLDLMYEDYQKKGISFYMTEHIGALNDMLRKMGYSHLLESGFCRRMISSALMEQGYERPYPLLDGEDEIIESQTMRENILFTEFEWIFGEDANAEVEKFIQRMLKSDKIIVKDHSILEKSSAQITEHDEEEILAQIDYFLQEYSIWNTNNVFEEDNLLEHLEFHIPELSKKLGIKESILEHGIDRKRQNITLQVKQEQRQVYDVLKKHRKATDDYFRKQNKKNYAKWEKLPQFTRKK